MKSPNILRCWAEIDLAALAFNLKRIRSLCGKHVEIIGVVKADAYGHGLFAVARSLAVAGVRTLAVANILEARAASLAAPDADILLLSPLLPDEIPDAIRHPRWLPTLSNGMEFAALEKAAACLRKQIRAHVKLDTGMGRLGAFQDEILQLLRRASRSEWITVAGLYSHLASADTDRDDSLRQVRRLQDFCAFASRSGFHAPPLHLQNSAGILRLRPFDSIVAARPGLALYGIPQPWAAWRRRFGMRPLKPVLSWKTRVTLVRDMPRGATISYASTFRARRRMRIAVLAAGYADGVSRKLSNRGEVLIRGRRCRILGRVTMDMTMADVTEVPNVRWGDVAVLIGRSGREEITVLDVARWAETNAYESLCNISKRVPRAVLER
ncbi:MAG: alanine racemase [Verrucomicrobia bacterium]|nr:alanine racemase [Verrucomicrobiota bacterium]